MHILLAAATKLEIQQSIDYLEKKEWSVNNLDIELLVTGVGSVPTSYSLAHHLSNRRPDLTIQAGIAGSFLHDNIGEIVSVKSDSLADNGVWEQETFKSTFDLGLMENNGFPFFERQLINPYDKLLLFTQLLPVKAITVNEITTDKKRIDWYSENLSPIIESMEGAAFHYVCLQENIPFIQLRSISNYIGERDKSKWEMRKAIDRLNEKLINLLNELSSYDETYFRI